MEHDKKFIIECYDSGSHTDWFIDCHNPMFFNAGFSPWVGYVFELYLSWNESYIEHTLKPY